MNCFLGESPLWVRSLGYRAKAIAAGVTSLNPSSRMHRMSIFLVEEMKATGHQNLSESDCSGR
jgi:hypothetical protein